jgi:hypothetical protein
MTFTGKLFDEDFFESLGDDACKLEAFLKSSLDYIKERVEMTPKDKESLTTYNNDMVKVKSLIRKCSETLAGVTMKDAALSKRYASYQREFDDILRTLASMQSIKL